ncbi:hypothetical protein JAB6_28190 [Janthinobacterium sp. HH104]|uniref:restriction endonuclease n=1 Tax=Janthinobacterium sp. HH104 TaxID=1537276 RepID=UPI000893A5B0|nr:restriction endonuclease [Janthinobacterium sp. HH104]OEZ83245.1 hypothetical protein JAB6_28190 [Janthinobacterium sp. HH104]
MLDFKELNKDGKDFELLIRELLFSKGFSVYWSGVGPDGGRDLICIEERDSFFAPDKKRWLIQCKHNAHSGKSVGIDDLDDIVDSCVQHEATGFILVCSTQPSSSVVNRLEAITKNPKNEIVAIYWDYVFIERALSCANLWHVAQRFFPISAESTTWKVYATERPNHWVVNYKGYYFHLSNRVGSHHEYHFESIVRRVSSIEAIEFPKKHFIRVRSVYFDDKNGNYTWYLDYMYPNNESPTQSSAEIKHALGDGWALEDGQVYSFDVKLQQYSQFSDHYDPDHYGYYMSNMQSYLNGSSRELGWKATEEAYTSNENLKQKLENERVSVFNNFVSQLADVDCLRVMRSVNSCVEDLDKFHMRRDWAELIGELEIEEDRFFSCWFMFEVSDVKEFLRLITYFPQGYKCTYRLTRVYVCVPDDGSGSAVEFDEDEYLFELTISANPTLSPNRFIAREELNKFMEIGIKGIKLFKSTCNPTISGE